MKKTISLLVALVLCLSLCACGGDSTNTLNKEGEAVITIPETGEVSQNVDNGQYTAYSYDGEATDLLTIEEVTLMPERWSESLGGDLFLNWKIKVRNTSGEDISIGSYMCIWYCFLDENEDIVHSDFLMGDSDVSTRNGRAEWLENINAVPAGWTNEMCESIAYIEIYGYSFSNFTKPQYEFENPVLIDIRDFFAWDDIAAQEFPVTIITPGA